MKIKHLLILLIALIGLSAKAHGFEYTYEGSTLKYEVTSEAECQVTGSVSLASELSIPLSATCDGVEYSVTSIEDWAFKNCSGLTSVTISNSVTSIGYAAFYRCSGLTSVTIPNSVTSIEDWAFKNCSGLTSVTIPNSVTSIGYAAFQDCSGLTSVTIPNSVTSIGGRAFMNCSGLTSVIIPNSVTSIYQEAFSCCSGLTSVTIPNSVTRIDTNAYGLCTNLTELIIEDGDSPIAFGFGCFMYAPIQNVYIGRSWTSQDSSIATSISRVTLGEKVTALPDYAFQGCNGLTTITIPNAVTSIGDYAFQGCRGLTTITIPNSVTTIGKEVFSNTNFRSIVVPATVTKIGDRAFGEIIELITINAVEPPVLTSSCMGYTSEDDLDRILVVCVNKSSANKYRDNEQWGDLMIVGKNEYKGTVHMSGTGRPLTEEIVGQIRVMPGNITNLKITGQLTANDWVLLNRNLVRCYDLDLSELDCTDVPEEAFKDMMRLQFVTLPSNARTLGASAFVGCNSLVSVKFGNNLTEIGDNAFSGLSTLRFMELPASLERIGSHSFEGTNCVQSFVAPSTLNHIGEYAFANCPTLRSVDLSASQLSQINAGSFGGCGHLREVLLPNSLQRIESRAFAGAPINALAIPEKVEYIGESAFEGTNLLAANLPSQLIEVSKSAFQGCPLMNSVSMGRNISSLGASVFAGNSKIKYISIIAAVPPAAPTSAFTGVSKRNCSVAIPTTKFWEYLNAPVWGGFSQLNNDLSVTAEISNNAEVNVLEESMAEEVENAISNEEANAATEESQDIANNEAIAEQNGIEQPQQVRRRGAGSQGKNLSLASAFMKLEDGQQFTISDSNVGYRFHITPKNGTEIVSVTLDGQELKDQISADGYLKVDKITKLGRLVVKTTEAPETPNDVMVNQLSITPTVWTGKPGSQFQITATVAPEDAANKTLAWTSSDESVATVDNQGTVNVLKVGTCVITVATTDGSNLTAECVITANVDGGIDSILNSECTVDVFTPNGICVLRQASATAVQTLMPGVYIVHQGNKTTKVVVE